MLFFFFHSTSQPVLNMPQMQEPITLAPEESHSQMNTDGSQSHTNGISGGQSTIMSQTDRFDPHFTQSVINATGPKA